MRGRQRAGDASTSRVNAKRMVVFSSVMDKPLPGVDGRNARDVTESQLSSCATAHMALSRCIDGLPNRVVDCASAEHEPSAFGFGDILAVLFLVSIIQ